MFIPSFGYRITTHQLVSLGHEYAIHLSRKNVGDNVVNKLSLNWGYGFVKRHSILNLRPKGPDNYKANACSKENISDHFTRLEHILQEYNLAKRPYLIFNITEVGLNPWHKPENSDQLLAKSHYSVSLCKSNEYTAIMGCGNAVGKQIPPYFVFPNDQFQPEWLSGGISGTDGTVSETGWSNSEILFKYIKNHLLKFVPQPTAEAPILLIIDGHKIHVNVPLNEWASEHHVILFHLPAFTCHILEPLDVACSKPLETAFMRKKKILFRDREYGTLTNQQMCEIGSKAYLESHKKQSIISGFKQTGIIPFTGLRALSEDVFNLNVPEAEEASANISAPYSPKLEPNDQLKEEATTNSWPKTEPSPPPPPPPSTLDTHICGRCDQKFKHIEIFLRHKSYCDNTTNNFYKDPARDSEIKKRKLCRERKFFKNN